MVQADVVGSKQAEDLLAHTHTYTVRDGAGSNNDPVEGSTDNGGSSTTDAAGGNETRPVNVYMMYCIRK